MYGSEVWSVSKASLKAIDKVHLRYVRCALSVKATTSNIITVGESGQYSPSVSCTISALNYVNRLHHLPNSSLVKQVYNELTNLDELGFTTWVSKIKEIATVHNLDITCDTSVFKIACRKGVRSNFIMDWTNELHDIDKNPMLRTYILFKSSFEQEPYLKLVKEQKYRVAIARLRSSSHTLAIERRRYERPKPPVEKRLCNLCNMVENEIHFVTQCAINQAERSVLESNVSKLYPSFPLIDDYQKFLFLMKNNDAKILTWFGKFLHNSFKTRNIFYSCEGI